MAIDSIEERGDIDQLVACVHEIEIEHVFLAWHVGKISLKLQIPNSKFSFHKLQIQFPNTMF